ncbi:Leu/Phe/Val dehydrogenase [Woeseia oceani]|uniref:Amino acid dehydrogenase n=1 Tax=Woeseia oceani TaxID=1548547 RepID=A0A193LHC5_9GAMM|nr:Glu/Leu/Phe/Val dehydrogenase dimerization domain-containing protein [Woeseia oceani]ANO51861.1 amino acid dehydrogenase [Woeseia oceani]
MSAFSNPAFDNHEQVTFCRDAATGLSAIIAIHSTALGPAAGGCRLWSYASDTEALYDVLRLSRGMSYKNAMADLRFGGGKAVILKTADFQGTDALYEKFGDFVDAFHGRYVTAEDVGMSVAVMEKIARRTRFVSGLPKKAGHAGGDPSPKTAFGIFKGIEAAVKFRLGNDTLRGLTVAVQGVGNVGYFLCAYLAKAGARLIVADIDQARINRVVDEFGAKPVALDEILFQDVDVVAPCALGAVLNEQSIPIIKSTIVAGGANNQLQTDADGRRLLEAGILYAPDYVINGGGIINVASEFYGDVDEDEVMNRVAAIGPRLTGIFQEARDSGLPTNEIADNQARRKIAQAKTPTDQNPQ